MASVLAYALVHCVTGLTLPRVDATSFSLNIRLVPGVWRRKLTSNTLALIFLSRNSFVSTGFVLNAQAFCLVRTPMGRLVPGT
ncbi:hypothetical protein N7524_005911 [Penicillium chrysogenum]|nr:hypothetical protein N7524_005911 [Penicillium chrysogenum]